MALRNQYLDHVKDRDKKGGKGFECFDHVEDMGRKGFECLDHIEDADNTGRKGFECLDHIEDADNTGRKGFEYYTKLYKTQRVICDRLPSDYVAKRLQLTRYIYNANSINKGEFSTFVNAVRYMDEFIGESVYSNIYIHPSQYMPIAGACLWISEKNQEDNSKRVDNVVKIWSKCGIEFCKCNIISTEVAVIEAFNWDFNIPSICHFAGKVSDRLRYIIRDAVENLQLQTIYLPSEIAIGCKEISVKIEPFSEVARKILRHDDIKFVDKMYKPLQNPNHKNTEAYKPLQNPNHKNTEAYRGEEICVIG